MPRRVRRSRFAFLVIENSSCRRDGNFGCTLHMPKPVREIRVGAEPILLCGAHTFCKSCRKIHTQDHPLRLRQNSLPPLPPTAPYSPSQQLLHQQFWEVKSLPVLAPLPPPLPVRGVREKASVACLVNHSTNSPSSLSGILTSVVSPRFSC